MLRHEVVREMRMMMFMMMMRMMIRSTPPDCCCCSTTKHSVFFSSELSKNYVREPVGQEPVGLYIYNR